MSGAQGEEQLHQSLREPSVRKRSGSRWPYACAALRQVATRAGMQMEHLQG